MNPTCTARRLTAVGLLAALLSGGLSAGLAGPASAAVDAGLGYDPVADKGALLNVATATSAVDSWNAGYTGKGVGVALIDTGVTRVRGLDTGNVWDGPDLSFDSQDPELAHRDAFGHGTHLASIIAGRDVVGTPKSYASSSRFNGIAPDATLYSVKVGAQDGAVDVSQVIAALNWVVAHKDDGPVPIRVVNLSYGTDGVQDTMKDPLAYAVEAAWKAGIVVVVAGGNDGSDKLTLANPARDPYVLAVGASDTRGTRTVIDDVVPAWASRGTNERHVDVVAPGVSVLGLRVPNGYADERNPSARVGDRFARASGTSQAAAVVSGEVALLLQEDPKLRPDQVKRQLMSTSLPFDSTTNQYRGNGLTQVRTAQTKDSNNSNQPSMFYGDGTGSLEAARGSVHVYDGTSFLTGEVDVFGQAWDPTAYSAGVRGGTIWQGQAWRGETWTGTGWEGQAWRGVAWTSTTWTGQAWRGTAWTGQAWRDGSWSGQAWRDGTWSGQAWRDASWSGQAWRDASWSSGSWA